MQQETRDYQLDQAGTELDQVDSGKTYAVFLYDTYYPQGGAKDFLGFVATLEEALTLIEEKKNDVVLGKYHVAEVGTMLIVAEGQIGWEN